MNIEQTLKEIIVKIKKVDLNQLNLTEDANVFEKINFDSFEIVTFVEQLDSTFNIDFGTKSTDFDSLKSWSALVATIESKIL